MCTMFDCATQLRDLENTMSTVNAVFLDVDAKRQELNNEGRNWIEKLKDAVYDVDDLLDEFRTIGQLRKQTEDADFHKKIGNFFSRNNEFFVNFNVSRDIKMLRKRLAQITKDHKDFGLTDVFVNKPVLREETCSVSKLDIIGREDEKEAIVSLLLSDNPSQQNFSFVNIVGVGGLGKTTLAQLVYKDDRVIEAFSQRIWVCVSEVSEKFNLEQILSKILEKQAFNLQVAQTEVREQLQGIRYLLVLDDVWIESPKEWSKLMPFLDSDVSGSKVIVTSRSKKVARATGEDSVMYNLEGLSEENSWCLFKLIAFGKQREDHQVDPDLVSIGKKIVKKCANVPLSIRVIASLLYDHGKDKWETFMSIDLADMRDEDGESSIMWTLMFSYYQLRTELKSCFSFCSLFPKDHIMQKELLINLWSAQGYLVANNNAQSIEYVGGCYFTILLNRCFFQDVKLDEHGDVVSFKMHDLMHDLALKVAGEESLIMNPVGTNHLGKKIRHLFRERGSSNLCLSNKLRTYVWDGNNAPSAVYAKDSNEVTQIVSKCKRLRVLSLPTFGIGGTFPDKVGKLLHLRYLDLTNNRLDILPKSITKLHNLQILILRGCAYLKELPDDIIKLVNLRTLNISSCQYMKELPEDISKLVNLRTLNIRFCNKLTYMPRGMRNLTNLQRLSNFVVGGVDVKQIEGSKLEELQALGSLNGELHIRALNFSSHNMAHATNRAFILKTARLKSLRIKCGSSYDNETEFDQSEVHETLLEDLCPNEDICQIQMSGYKGMKMPRWVSLMDYSDMNGLQHVMSLSRFRCLKSLSLDDLPNVEYMEIENDAAWESRTLFFPFLEKLRLHKMTKLKGWWRGLRWREMEGGGGCLVDANGNDDIHMEHAVGLPCFPRLRALTIDDCKSMAYLPPCPHLKEMYLRRVNDALTFCMKGGASSSNVSTSSSGLEKLIIYNARVMNTVLLSEFAKGGVINIELREDKVVKSMGTVREGFERVGSTLKNLKIGNCRELDIEDEEEEGMPWKYLQSLSSLVFLYNLPKMVKLPKGLRHLTSLQTLSVLDCSNLEEVGECIGSLTSLQSLKLSYCHKLKGLLECIGFLTSLQYLTIRSEQLESLPESMRHLTSLSSLRIYRANNKLQERCRESDGEYWPRISHIRKLHISESPW